MGFGRAHSGGVSMRIISFRAKEDTYVCEPWRTPRYPMNRDFTVTVEFACTEDEVSFIEQAVRDFHKQTVTPKSPHEPKALPPAPVEGEWEPE